MTEFNAATNLETYDAPAVVAHYAALNYLTPCERLLFDTYVPAGIAILDLGVGGGRTTAYLARRASRYVGVDNAAAMVEACRAKFPGREFAVADAADLSAFPDASFDVIVFAFNGIDFVLPASSRRRCLEHMRRILKAGGVAIFSSHNARSVFVRPSWNSERLQRVAQRFSGDFKVLYQLLLILLTVARAAAAWAQCAWATLLRLFQRVPSRVFWRGEGSLVDSAHGGLLKHYWTQCRAIGELAEVHR